MGGAAGAFLALLVCACGSTGASATQEILGAPGPAPARARRFELPDMSRLERDIVCVGPLCLKTGKGTMLGLGCGVGMGIGAGIPLTGAGGSFDSIAGSGLGRFLLGMPGGHVAIEIIRKLMRKFPKASIGAGCGIGMGYGVGVGLHWGKGVPSNFFDLRAKARDVMGGGQSEAAMVNVSDRVRVLEERVDALEKALQLASKGA